jgi:hypothetical protein
LDDDELLLAAGVLAASAEEAACLLWLGLAVVLVNLMLSSDTWPT